MNVAIGAAAEVPPSQTFSLLVKLLYINNTGRRCRTYRRRGKSTLSSFSVREKSFCWQMGYLPLQKFPSLLSSHQFRVIATQ